jgi:hypothetical protein
MSASDNDRISRIMLDDSTSEFGSHIVINPSKTQWKTALVERRDFNEINAFHAFDSWKFTEGSAIHTGIPTNMIKSITIPADRLGVGIVIGGLVGAAFGAGLAFLINSRASNAIYGDASSSINTLLIIEEVVEALTFAFGGAVLGGQAGASHQTMYVRQ